MYKQMKLLAGLAMLAASADKQLFDIGPSKVYVKPIPKNNLPCWDINGKQVFAKDEKTAIKYAKKRGYWCTGAIVKKNQ